MQHGNAAASVSTEQWREVFRPALYRQCARARRALKNPANPTAHERQIMLELLDTAEALAGATELMADSDGGVNERLRRTTLMQQARLLLAHVWKAAS